MNTCFTDGHDSDIYRMLVDILSTKMYTLFCKIIRLAKHNIGGGEMYHICTEEELRTFCRQSIESLEMWARRLIHEELTEKYGTDYINHKTSEENYLIKNEVRDHVQTMWQNNNGRFHRTVDTLFFEHIIYFLCNPAFYRDMFGKALNYAYPNGCNEARVFLKRITPIRNALSHSNPISIRQAEQAICYSHDFVEGLKKYYKEKGEEEMWNYICQAKVDTQKSIINRSPVRSCTELGFCNPKRQKDAGY